jgi:hypothetical protein
VRAFAATCVLVACAAPPRPRQPERDAPDPGTPAAPRPAARTFPPPPQGLATADLVVMIGGELTAHALAGNRLVATGRTRLANVAEDDEAEALLTGIGYGGWADRDHFFVTIDKREVAMVTATSITEVPLPSEDSFKLPKPLPGDDGTEYDEGDLSGTGDQDHTGLIVTAGAAWWSACPWGLSVDGFQCHTYVHARLWPSATIETGPALEARTFSWTDTLPGYTIKTGDPKAITCEHAGKKTKIAADFDVTEEIEGVHWVSASPPRLLVVYGHAGLASLVPDRWTLHDGCTAKPLATGDTAEPGPSGLWLATAGEGDAARQILYRGGDVLGDFVSHARIWLRPAR